MELDQNSHINTNDGGGISGQQNGSLPGTSSNGSTPQMSVILTIRLLMQSKEVGSIIGKKGDHVKQIREKSGAKVNISDGSCPERIVTITGNVTTINKAFSMICKKSEEDLQALPNSVPQPPITMRLIVPATQCGSLIGKRGSKIKEIRETTGASIQVATEMLPSSTERAVTISGTCTAIIDCMQEICQILLEAPPKGTNLPFRPKPNYNPLLIASSAAAAAAAQQQATQHLTAVMMQQNQQNQQAQAVQAQQLQASAAAATVGYNPSVFAHPELARLHLAAVPRFNFPAALFASSALGNGLMTIPNSVVSSSANTVLDPTAAAAALFWSQQQQSGGDEKHTSSQNAAVAHAAASAAAAAAAAQNHTSDQTLDYLSNFGQPYLLNNGVLVGRTMTVGGTPLKSEAASSSGAAVLQSSATGRRFSPY